ncbi:DUF6790 family protein [Nocardiopsis sp. MG754419]|uniref:DUF6790 family protein n=1 Tax=Nocardiopsis sp. MG754419 TaxID=2259865 RepID=UPI001BAC9350|nr:DUF6790 family protein [Nocardiopsis sp. MG754419]MBR8741005.1 hypothetical protein [Nocardiopsis sp. MG754419]
MISDIIATLIGNYMTTCFVLGLLVAGVVIARHRGHRSGAVVSGILLNMFILFAVGVAQAINFVMHSFFGDFAARTIGWAQSPFQLELAFASLGFAVIAFVVHGRRAQFRGKVALVLATAVTGFGAAGGHIYQMAVNADFAVNNTGLLLVMDILIPTFALALILWHALARGGEASPTDARTVHVPGPRRGSADVTGDARTGRAGRAGAAPGEIP